MESNEPEGVTNIAIRSASTLFVLKMRKWGEKSVNQRHLNQKSIPLLSLQKQTQGKWTASTISSKNCMRISMSERLT
jgi:hypothetical protein